MFTRITKFQRLDYMQQGFIHLGYSTAITDMLSTKSHEQICRALDNLVNSIHMNSDDPYVCPRFDRFIVKHTSQDMTDNKGGFYTRTGKSYLYKNLLIHLYNKGYTTSIMMVNI